MGIFDNFGQLSFWGNIASIIGLVITGWVAYGVRKIQSKIIFKATISDIIASFEELHDQLRIIMRNEYSKKSDRKREIQDIQHLIEVYLKHLIKISDNEIRREAKDLVKILEKAKNKPERINDNIQWDTLRKIRGIIESLKTRKKEQPWRIDA
jgi:hypothetical protein